MTTPPLTPQHSTDVPPVAEPPETAACMNCGTKLEDQFCYVCGQRKQRRIVSVLALIGEFFSELANWDSRMWRTLTPLFFKPGLLTKAYMEGKRARFIPPVRLYLISSLVFFLVISFSPKAMFADIGRAVDKHMGGLHQPVSSQIDRETLKSILEEAGASDVSVNGDEDTEDTPVVSLDDRDVIGVDDPIDEPSGKSESATDDADPAPGDQSAVAQNTEAGVDATEPEPAANPSATTEEMADDMAADQAADSESDDPSSVLELCEQIKTADLGNWEMLRSYFYNTCMSFSTWRGLLQFANELIDNLPTTLLILLPLMAFVNKILYLFSRRYYVEHLLFYVHNFSFLFLFSLVMAAITAAVGLLGPSIGDFMMFAGLIYVIYYFIRSMRVVYEQGRFFTFVKWFLLVITFLVLTLFVLTFLTLATAALHAL